MSQKRHAESSTASEKAEGGSKRARPTLKRSNLFNKDLKLMMYAFGDEDPTPDSVSVMEDILVDFITVLCQESNRVTGGMRKVKVDDFKFILRQDEKKIGRIEELLNLQKEIQQSRKLFDEGDDK